MNDPAGRLRLVVAAPASTDPASGNQPASLATRSDDDLMLLARGGMSAAFDVLVRRHQQKVIRVAARLLGRTSLAHDVAQNAFLQVYRSLATYQPRGKFVPYLNRVLLNQCRMVYRSVRVERMALEVASTDPIEPGDPGGEAHILERERQREVEWALRGLSEKLRDVMVLRYSGGLSYDEIAEALGVPVGTVKRRLFDGMEKLRRAMEEG